MNSDIQRGKPQLDPSKELEQAHAYIKECRNWIHGLDQQLKDKQQNEEFYLEQINRLKQTCADQDDKIKKYEAALEQERERNLVQEQNIQGLIAQLNHLQQFQQKWMNNSDDNDGLKQMDEDNRRLQKEAQKWEFEVEKHSLVLKQVIEKLCNISHTYLPDLSKEDMLEMLLRKTTDTEQYIKEIDHTMGSLHNQLQDQKSQLTQRDSQLSDLEKKHPSKTKCKPIQTQTQLTIIDIIKLDQIQDSGADIDQMAAEVKKWRAQVEAIGNENEQLKQEMNIIVKNSNYNMQSVSQLTDESEAISRLNAKMTSMKVNDNSLQHQLNEWKEAYYSIKDKIENMQDSSQLSTQKVHPPSQSTSSQMPTENNSRIEMQSKQIQQKVHQYEEMVSEQELIIMDQRESLIRLQEENINAKGEMKQMTFNYKNQIENLMQKLKHQKDIQLVQQNQQQSFMMTGSSITKAGTNNVDVEKMRQYIQQQELCNLNLKYQIEELELYKANAEKERADIADENIKIQKELSQFRSSNFSSIQNHHASIIDDKDGSKLLKKIQQQKDKIQQLKAVISNQTSQYQAQTDTQGGDTGIPCWTQARVNDLQRTNERLRQEIEQSLFAVGQIRDEYSTKLEDLMDLHGKNDKKYNQEILSLKRKNEQLTSQIDYMEKKETRLYGQLEEAKQVQSEEFQDKEVRTKDLENLLFKKEELISELEKEVKTKDKCLMEKQEQLSMLVSTLESQSVMQSDPDSLKQKILNLSAELCAVKSSVGSGERKANELQHQNRKQELQIQKLQKQNTLQVLKIADYNNEINSLKKDNEISSQKLLNQEHQLQDKEKELNEFKYKAEREEFQNSMKEEIIIQLKDHMKKNELAFKKEVEKIRKECIDKFITSAHQATHNKQSNTGRSFKMQLQSLQVLFFEILEKSQQYDVDKDIMIKEMERILVSASNTIESLEDQLDASQLKIWGLENKWNSLSINTILVNKNILLLETNNRLIEIIEQRQFNNNKFSQERDLTIQRSIKSLETQNTDLLSELEQTNDELSQLKQRYNNQKHDKEELERSLVCYQQELDTQQQMMERKAEISVDQRFKSRDEQIKTYFDSQISKMLIGSTNDKGRIMDLGREICALKMQISSFNQQNMMVKAENESYLMQIQNLKEIINEYEIKKGKNFSSKNEYTKSISNEFIMKIDLEKKKNLVLEKSRENLKLKELIDGLKQELALANAAEVQDSFKSQLKSLEEGHYSHQKSQELSPSIKNEQQIKELQEALLQLRSQHLSEMEEIKLNCELQISEAKRQIQREKEQLEKRFSPGQAPGEIKNENHQLIKKLQDIKTQLDSVWSENMILKKKLESERYITEDQKLQINSYKQALTDLESTFIDISSQAQQQQQTLPTEGGRQSSSRKHNFRQSRSKNKDKSQQQLNREATDNISQSKIIMQESSLNVSAFTSVQLDTQRNNHQSNNNQAREFTVTPPAIVRALVDSKMQELQALNNLQVQCAKNEELQREILQMKQKLEGSKYLLQKNMKNNDMMLVMENNEGESDDITKDKLLKLNIENEELRMKVAENLAASSQQQLRNAINPTAFNKNYNDNILQQDMNTLLYTVLCLSTQVATNNASIDYQKQPSESTGHFLIMDSQISIQEAQRMVIKSLLRQIKNQSDVNINYSLSDEGDRRLLYLELLEQQNDTTEQVMQTLQQYVKKLQIEIQGNIQSAAAIKGSFLDLAQNIKHISEEVSTLKQVCGLIKVDILSMRGASSNNSQPVSQRNQMINNTIGQQDNTQSLNPFAQTYKQQQQESDQLQNQLSITHKVKQSLEQQLVQLRIQHTQETQELQTSLSQAMKSKDSLLLTNTELSQKVANLEQLMEKLKMELQMMIGERQELQEQVQETKNEKQLISKNQANTSKHIQKLQSDLHDWRKQTDENLQAKDKIVAELKTKCQALEQERDKYKAEKQMLRTREKDQKPSGSQFHILEEENKSLIEKLNKEMEDRKQEIEFWVNERANMRQTIEELQNKQGPPGILEATEVDKQAKQIKKKSQKKLKIKDIEIKNKDKELTELKDALQRVKLNSAQLEQRIRENEYMNREQTDQVRSLQHRLKEAEFEKDLFLAERNNAIASNDITAQTIQVELNSLRECFSKLKVERDELLFQMNKRQQIEYELKCQVDKQTEELRIADEQLEDKDRKQNDEIKLLENKHQILIADLRYIKQENDRLKMKEKELANERAGIELVANAKQQAIQEKAFDIETKDRQMREAQQIISEKTDQIMETRKDLQLLQAEKCKDLEQIRQEIEEAKDQSLQLMQVYEHQIETLKSKLVSTGKMEAAHIDQTLRMAQKDQLIKQLKKDFAQIKLKLTKSRDKNQEFKKIISNSENLQPGQLASANPASSNGIVSQKQTSSKYGQKKQKEAQQAQCKYCPVDNQEFQNLLDKMQTTNKALQDINGLQIQLQKSEGANYILAGQIKELKQKQDDMDIEMQQIADKSEKVVTNDQSKKQSNEQLKQYKSEIKQLQIDIKQIKQEWISPLQQAEIIEQNKSLASQLKNAKDELSRKKEILSQVKQAKEQTEEEANQLIQGLEGLKDDNLKLQKVIKESNKKDAQLRELKQQNEYGKAQEKRMKDDIQALSDKMKVLKAEIVRKDQLIKDLKDKFENIQDEVEVTKDKKDELEQYKSLLKKNRVEIEIKENQVRALKTKVEQQESEIEQLKQQIPTLTSNVFASQQDSSKLLDKCKSKVRKYENLLRNAMLALRRVGRELNQSREKLRVASYSRGGGSTKQKSDFLDQDLYKDSVDILGVSMDELEEFVNPNKKSVIGQHHQSRASADAGMFLSKLDQAVDSATDHLGEQDIEQICDYCVQMIQELNEGSCKTQ